MTGSHVGQLYIQFLLLQRHNFDLHAFFISAEMSSFIVNYD